MGIWGWDRGPVRDQPIPPSTQVVPAELVEALYDSFKDGFQEGDWTRVMVKDGDEGRWRRHHTLVLRHADGGFWGIDYETGLTEMQDHDFPWRPEYGSPPETVELRAMYPVPVSRVDYWYAK